MDLDFPFFQYHAGVIDSVRARSGNLPPVCNMDWDAYVIRIHDPLPGRDPDLYHMISSAELTSLSPRLWRAVHGLTPDQKPYIYESLRKSRYAVSAASLHPLKVEARTIQIFSLAATG